MPKPIASTNKVAVKVSYRLQWTAIIVFIATLLLQLSYMISALWHTTGGWGGSGFPFFAANSLMPVVVFLLLLWFSPKYVTTINRWFIATIKTMIILGVLGVLQGIRSLAMTTYYNFHRGNLQAPPPSWMTSSAIDIAVAAICLVGVIIYIISSSNKR